LRFLQVYPTSNHSVLQTVTWVRLSDTAHLYAYRATWGKSLRSTPVQEMSGPNGLLQG
jgi:hypothetical protein